MHRPDLRNDHDSHRRMEQGAALRASVNRGIVMSETVITMFLTGGEVAGDIFLFIGSLAVAFLTVFRLFDR